MSVRIRGLDVPDAPPADQWRQRQLWAACWRGDVPSEALAVIDPRLVEDLVYELWQLGWTDAEIAAHTKSTTYTIARIRARLGLAPNRSIQGATAA